MVLTVRLKFGIMIVILALTLTENAASAQDTTVTFPQGWTLSRLAIISPSGQTVPGSTARALLTNSDGHPLAAIELTLEPQPNGQLRDLNEAAKQMQDAASDLYKKSSLAFICQASVSRIINGTIGFDTQCKAAHGKVTLIQQRVVLWSRPGMLASLSYTAGVQDYPVYLKVFERVLLSVKSN